MLCTKFVMIVCTYVVYKVCDDRLYICCAKFVMIVSTYVVCKVVLNVIRFVVTQI